MELYRESLNKNQYTDSRIYWLWLANALGPACRYSGELLDIYGSAQEVYRVRDKEDFSSYLPQSICKRLTETEPMSFLGYLNSCIEQHIFVITPEDIYYPEMFLHMPDLPLVLYCTGIPELLNGGHYIGVVGSRRPSQYGIEACRLISTELAESGVTIVSGLADGLDGEGHRSAVRAKAPTIGILGCPIDHTYPAGNRNLRIQIEQNGAILSEYGPGYRTTGMRYSFLQRNRLIAALGEVLCVLEARVKSGTLNTVLHAEEYGKIVYALPGSIFSPLSEGTNHLLAEKRAKPLLHSADVLLQLGLLQRTKSIAENKRAELSKDAQLILKLIGPTPKALENICIESEMSVEKILAVLTELELHGKIIPLAGRRYLLK